MNISNSSIEELVCDESFQHYCLGNDTAAQAYWEDQLLQHPGKREMVAEARRLVNILSANQGNRQEQSNQLRDGLMQAAQLQQLLSLQTPKRSKRGLLYAVTGIAAAGLILLGIRILMVKPTPATHTATQNPRQTYILADGSVITLREHGQLLVNPSFNTSNREVTLEGEAFFDVKHNGRFPFIVHTNTADITVLGTTFNVSAYPGMETAATLFRGKIAVNMKAQPGKKIILIPDQQLVIRNTSEAEYKITPVQHEKTWIRNRLEIDNEPLEEIAKKLEKWYGIPVIFSDDAVKSYRYSGTFESETVLKALEALQLSYPFNFKVTNNVIIISK
ncbi:FecR family protein [Chitinophaga sp. CF118]|uniref:FecR family protein n=1 Tax=Chitinophaga sp. CF118 TaxID=1884367 RepID=UPI0008ED5F3E|nr:FecR domain-containing protein [Chitinophaga sp. CF118]SFE80243.1 FecR family protein [Chitinophaga sp. CF118]